jgi:hypothetical protein
MRLTPSSLATATIIIGVLGSAIPPTSATAGETHAFVIAANDGYGVEDCLAGSSECGQVVADAWCEAHGHGSAISFGLQSAFSGGAATKVSATSEPYVINCRD